MILLLAGLALWWGAHLFKRIAPGLRAKMGEPGKGVVTLALVASIVLMVIGYRMADTPFYWGRSSALVGVNNLMMFLAFYLFAASGMKTWITTKIRHPQLTAMKLWAVAHLLVNGDLASIVLFGGLLAWAVVEVIVINRADGRDWTGSATFAVQRETRAALGSVVALVAVMMVHFYLGAVPWG